MVLGEIHCYTNFLLDNSIVHVPFFIFYLETRKVMVTTLFSFPVLFQSSELSNLCIFRFSLSLYRFKFRKFNIFRKIEVQIVMILSSESS